MAKKPKSDEEGAPEGGDAKAPAKSKKKLMLIGGVGLLAVLGGGGYFMFAGKAATGPDAPKVVKAPTFVEVREMMVNLGNEPNQERQRFLKFKVALEVSNPKASDAIKPMIPRIEDAFQVYVRELRPSDLEGSAGVYRLREELLRRVNMAIYPAKIDAVLFKDIVLQ